MSDGVGPTIARMTGSSWSAAFALRANSSISAKDMGAAALARSPAVARL